MAGHAYFVDNVSNNIYSLLQLVIWFVGLSKTYL